MSDNNDVCDGGNGQEGELGVEWTWKLSYVVGEIFKMLPCELTDGKVMDSGTVNGE